MKYKYIASKNGNKKIPIKIYKFEEYPEIIVNTRKIDKNPLDPELLKFIEEQAKRNKYDPDKDPVLRDFRRKMKMVRYEPVDNTWGEVLAMIIFLVLIFLASIQK